MSTACLKTHICIAYIHPCIYICYIYSCIFAYMCEHAIMQIHIAVHAGWKHEKPGWLISKLWQNIWLGSEDPIGQACNHVMTLTARQHEGGSCVLSPQDNRVPILKRNCSLVMRKTKQKLGTTKSNFHHWHYSLGVVQNFSALTSSTPRTSLGQWAIFCHRVRPDQTMMQLVI